jgi:hypothetical protein
MVTEHVLENKKVFRVKNPLKNANIPRTIRFTEDIYDKLHKIAFEKDISFNLTVLECCKFALDNYDEDETN